MFRSLIAENAILSHPAMHNLPDFGLGRVPGGEEGISWGAEGRVQVQLVYWHRQVLNVEGSKRREWHLFESEVTSVEDPFGDGLAGWVNLLKEEHHRPWTMLGPNGGDPHLVQVLVGSVKHINVDWDGGIQSFDVSFMKTWIFSEEKGLRDP